MWITLLAIVCVIGMIFYPQFFPVDFSGIGLETAGLMALGGSLLLILIFFLNTQALNPLTRLEQKLIPNLIDLFQHHAGLHTGRILIFMISFISFFLALTLLAVPVNYRVRMLEVWILLFGLGLDLLKMQWNGLLHLLNPHYLTKELEHAAKVAIQNSQDDKLWQSIDNLAEVAVNAVERNKIALSSQVLGAFPPVMQIFYASSRSISRSPDLDAEVEKQTGRDEASYTLFYLLQRLELINDKALKNRLESVCRQMVMVLGKIIMYGAKLDLSLVSFPTHFLVKFGLKAQQHYFQEVGELTTSTLLQIAKYIVHEVELTYAELIEPFQTIIRGLENLAKGEFKQNKFANIKVLVQPLLELKELLDDPKIAKHRDAPAIRIDIDRALGEFEALEQVMRTLPPLPEIIASEES